MSVRDGEGKRRSGKHFDNKFAARKPKGKTVTNFTGDVTLAPRKMDLFSSEESLMRPLKGNFPPSGRKAQTF